LYLVTDKLSRPFSRTVGTARRLATLGPARDDAPPSLRICLSLGAPLVLLLVTGHLEWGLFASFGAFTSIYARYQDTGRRLRQQGLVGVMLTVCVGLGSLCAHAAGVLPTAVGPWLTAVVGALVAGSSAVLIMVKGLRPTGAVFPVFAATAVASAPATAPVLVAVAVSAGSVLWCLVLSALAHWTESGSAGPASETPTYSRTDCAQEFGRYALAAVVAGGIATVAGIPSPYWAQVAAVVPLSAPHRREQVERGIHRIAGTVIGVLLTAFLLSFPAQPWQLVVWVMIMQFLVEMFVLRNYSLALLFITPLALLMVYTVHPQPVGPMLLARVGETAIGAVVGILVVLGAVLVERRTTRRAHA
jgi:hypothetical protein